MLSKIQNYTKTYTHAPPPPPFTHRHVIESLTHRHGVTHRHVIAGFNCNPKSWLQSLSDMLYNTTEFHCNHKCWLHAVRLLTRKEMKLLQPTGCFVPYRKAEAIPPWQDVLGAGAAVVPSSQCQAVSRPGGGGGLPHQPTRGPTPFRRLVVEDGQCSRTPALAISITDVCHVTKTAKYCNWK